MSVVKEDEVAYSELVVLSVFISILLLTLLGLDDVISCNGDGLIDFGHEFFWGWYLGFGVYHLDWHFGVEAVHQLEGGEPCGIIRSGVDRIFGCR